MHQPWDMTATWCLFLRNYQKMCSAMTQFLIFRNPSSTDFFYFGDFFFIFFVITTFADVVVVFLWFLIPFPWWLQYRRIWSQNPQCWIQDLFLENIGTLTNTRLHYQQMLMGMSKITVLPTQKYFVKCGNTDLKIFRKVESQEEES